MFGDRWAIYVGVRGAGIRLDYTLRLLDQQGRLTGQQVTLDLGGSASRKPLGAFQLVQGQRLSLELVQDQVTGPAYLDFDPDWRQLGPPTMIGAFGTAIGGQVLVEPDGHLLAAWAPRFGGLFGDVLGRFDTPQAEGVAEPLCVECRAPGVKGMRLERDRAEIVYVNGGEYSRVVYDRERGTWAQAVVPFGVSGQWSPVRGGWMIAGTRVEVPGGRLRDIRFTDHASLQTGVSARVEGADYVFTTFAAGVPLAYWMAGEEPNRTIHAIRGPMTCDGAEYLDPQ